MEDMFDLAEEVVGHVKVAAKNMSALSLVGDKAMKKSYRLLKEAIDELD